MNGSPFAGLPFVFLTTSRREAGQPGRVSWVAGVPPVPRGMSSILSLASLPPRRLQAVAERARARRSSAVRVRRGMGEV
jgi:hypothetical protein